MIKVNHKRIAWIACMMALLMLSGCSKKVKQNHVDNNGASQGESEIVFLDEGETVWVDNKVDDLHAVANLEIRKITEEDDLVGGTTKLFACENGCAYFKNHLKSNYKNNWSGVNGIYKNGEEFAKRIEVESERLGTQIHLLGPVSGENGYVACYEDRQNDEINGFWLYSLDENFQVKSFTYFELKISEGFKSIMGDSEGNYHALYMERNGKLTYAVISPDGQMIIKAKLEYVPKLCANGKGNIYLFEICMASDKPNDRWFYYADVEKGVLSELPVSKDEFIRKKMLSDIYNGNCVSKKEPFLFLGVVSANTYLFFL